MVGHMKNAAKNAAHTTTWMDHHTVLAVGHQDIALGTLTTIETSTFR